MENRMKYTNSILQSHEDNYMNFMKKFFSGPNVNHSRSTNDIYTYDQVPFKEPEVPLRLARRSEITNPDLYYKQESASYQSLRKKEKEFLDYNYHLMNTHDKKRLDIKPYSSYGTGSFSAHSNMQNNVILNPVPNYNYNKYFVKSFNSNNSNTDYYNNMTK